MLGLGSKVRGKGQGYLRPCLFKARVKGDAYVR